MEEVEAKRLAEEEIKSSQERLEAAEILFKNKKVADSISRSYYAMFHAARAILYLYGIQPRTHEGVMREFSRIVIEENLMDKEFGRDLRQVFEMRESGDYRIGVILEEEDAEDALKKAEKFVEEVKKVSRKIIEEKFS